MSPEELKKREKYIRETWFKDHVVEVTPGERILTWKKPKDSNYWTRYIVCGNILCVYGDIGEAVYGWSERVTFEWIAGLDLGYFHSKCCASEVGRPFNEWRRELAEEALEPRFLENADLRRTFKLEYGPDALGFKNEWIIWLSQHGWDVFGDVTDLGDIGEDIHIRCQGHLVGLQMAMEQLKAKNEIPNLVD